MVLERNIFFFSGWVPYFVSLQEEHVLMYKNRERWEQGLKPDKASRCGALRSRVVGYSTSLCGDGTR